MQRYYFDLKFDGENPSRDEEGSLLPNMDAALIEATRALCDFTKEMVAGEQMDTLVIIVRDDAGPVLEAALTFQVKRVS